MLRNGYLARGAWLRLLSVCVNLCLVLGGLLSLCVAAGLTLGY